MKLIIRDPNWNTSAMTQAISALISLPVGKRPDVLIAHNPNVQVLVSLLKEAQKLGIWVVQINMVSSYKTGFFVGANWTYIGRQQANDIIKQCGTGTGESGKVALVQGEMTSQVCIEETHAIMEVFKKDPKIKVVSNLGTGWDANKAHDNIATVLQQHPDLSAIVGYWGPMTLGAAQAVREAGLLGKVKVYSSGEVAPSLCEAVRSGLFYKYWNYDAVRQGHDIMTAVKTLLQLGQHGMKPGDVKMAIYSSMDILTKENVDRFTCWSPEPKLK